ncbi:Hydroxyaromatic non-oxidative decarboxylaseprotein D [Salmonella bongori]|nr:Hydroxyaromatic non-oxidative decarboxylaseprotein D [Salmonella bongori]
MICPRCADEHIEVMATSPVKGIWDGTSMSALSVYLARYRTATPHQPRTLSASVSYDAKRY